MHQLPRKVTQSANLSQSKYSLSEVCKIERLTENTPAQNVFLCFMKPEHFLPNEKCLLKTNPSVCFYNIYVLEWHIQ